MASSVSRKAAFITFIVFAVTAAIGAQNVTSETTSLSVPPPETINDLAQYIVAQVYRANQLTAEDRQGVTPVPILLGGQHCVLCTLVSDLVLGVGTFLVSSLQGVYRLMGVPFLNLAVTLASPVIIAARILINFSSMVTGMVARAFQPLLGPGDPSQFSGTQWGITNALAYAMLYWPVSILMDQAIIPFFTA